MIEITDFVSKNFLKKSHNLRVNETKITTKSTSNRDGFGFGHNKELG